MGYSDQKFYTRPLILLADTVTATSTGTASAVVMTNTALTGNAANLPQFQRRTEVTGGWLVVRTAPNAGAASAKVAIMNGTATAAVFTISTLTAGQGVAPTVTAANAIFSASSAPSINILSTTTASQTVTQGSYDIYLENVERYA